MKRPHPFRFVRRKQKRGYVYFVIYDMDISHPRSTGVLVNSADRKYKWEPAGINDAIAWAYTNLEVTRCDVNFRQFVEGFFDNDSFWVQRMKRKGRTFGAEYLPAHRGRLKNYILPRWGALKINQLSTKAIDEWLVELNSARTGLPLAPASIDKILTAMRIILNEAQYHGYIDDNPTSRIEPFDTGEGRGREPFTIHEIHTLFANEEPWQSLEWYTYFLMQWTCGLRPGEVGGFMLSDWIKEYHGAVISRAVENATLQIKGLKTENRGMTVKPVVFSEKLENILTKLEFRGYVKDQLLFQLNDKPIRAETANKHFKASAKRMGVELRGRTQYSLRHTWVTEALKRLPEKEVERMAGHRSLRREYDHRKGIDFLKAAEPLREVINGLIA